MDVFTTLMLTYKNLGVSAYEYLRDRLSFAGDKKNGLLCRMKRLFS